MNMGKKGFTIIELLITISIMTLLLAAAAISISTARRNSRDGKRVGDISLIGQAIDQAGVVKGGSYPTNVNGGDPSVMCASEILSSSNSNGLDLSLFPQRSIPTDPLAATAKTQGCTSFRDGYTYHSSVGASLAKQNGVACYTYLLEVGLEAEKGPDETTLQPGAAINRPTVTTPRYQYFLPGRYTGTTCP